MTDEEIHEAVYGMGRAARKAAHALAVMDAEAKNVILRAMAAELRSQAAEILGISSSKAYTDLKYALSWLRLEIAHDTPPLHP